MLNLFHFAPMVWWFRMTLSRILFMMFGMFLPALDSARAIINNDAESIREFLTFWCVLGISLYLEALLNVFSLLKNWPPEIRIIFTLWLTLPEFQGSYRIYSYILKPLFEKHEDEIDKQLDVLGREVRNKANRQLQTILWQLFLSPNDGLLAGALSYSSTTNALASWIVSTNKEPIVVPPLSTKEYSLSQQLLRSFRQMLTDGIHADVCMSISATNNIESEAAHLSQHHALHDVIDTNKAIHRNASTRQRSVMRLARISLVGTCYMTVTKSCDDNDDDDDNDNNNNDDSKGDDSNNQSHSHNKINNNHSKESPPSSSETSATDSTEDDDNSTKSVTDTNRWRTVHGSNVSLASGISTKSSSSSSIIAVAESSTTTVSTTTTSPTQNKLISIPGIPLRFAGYLVRGIAMSNQDPNVIVINYVSLSLSSSSSSSSSSPLKPHESSSGHIVSSISSSPLYSSTTTTVVTLFIKAADSEESDAILAGMTVVVADIKRTVSLRINRLVTLLHAAAAATTATTAVTATTVNAKHDFIHQSNTASSSTLFPDHTAGLHPLSSHDVGRLFSRWKQVSYLNYHQ